jgi:hypothetical protein
MAPKKIDIIRRRFLWHESDDARNGHCLINWKRVQRTKSIGGLGILDLERFNKALQLRRRWFKWKNQNKPRAGMAVSHSATEVELFRACTTITLGDGKNTSFWHDRWLQWKGAKRNSYATAQTSVKEKQYSGASGDEWKMDERTQANTNHGRGSTIHPTVQLDKPGTPDGAAGRHSMEVRG